MKYFPLLFLLFVYSCSTKNHDDEITSQISRAQSGLQNLVDSFKTEYKLANSDFLKDSVIGKYNLKIYDYLANIYIDSIRVHIDSVIVNGLTITTKSHCNNDIAFQYSLTFLKSMNKNQDSVFRFMKGLIPGTDTTINFSFMGSFVLNDPIDKSTPTLKIFAFPSP
ncbi:MAG: hypothetical protein WAU24_08005 [Chitinophagaceae bacterium]